MSKRVVKNYVFDASAKTITLPDFSSSFDLSRLAKITNATRNIVIYLKNDGTKTGTSVGNVITVAYDTVAMSNSDTLLVEYEGVFGTESKFTTRSSVLTGVQSTSETWALAEDTEGTHIISEGGDSSGSSYLRISLNPFVEANGVTLTSTQSYNFPMRVVFGTSISQRIVGQEVFVGMIATDTGGAVTYNPTVPDKAITGTTASVTSNVATFTLVNHGLKGGDRVVFFGCADHRMNVGPVIVTVLSQDTFTVPLTIANASYSTVGGSVRMTDPMRYAANGAGLLFENATSTNASFVSRRSGTKFRSLNTTVATTTAAQTNTSPYTDAFNASGTQELYFSADEISYRSFSSDSNAGISGSAKYSQAIPNEDLPYKLQVRARNLTGFSLPIGRVISAAKTGTTTATVVTDAPHGLVAGDFVQIYGTRDQTNFANLSTQTAIASVVSPTSFTVVWGSAVTASTAGGVVWLNQGQIAAPGVNTSAVVQSISRTSNVLSLTGNASWSGLLPGEYVNVYGLETSAKAYEGAFKVLRLSTTTLELESVGPDFGSITTGGTVIKRTDVRLHYVRVLDYERKGVEILGGRGNTTDINNAAPVSVVGSAAVAVVQSTGSASQMWNAAGYGGYLVTDVASAALTTTTTTTAVTPGIIGNIGTLAHSFNVIVTAVSGTTPTLDVGVEESIDNGTNWVRVYDFPRITANGAYTSPLIRAQYGTRYRYVQTVAGTTPSFTRQVNRVMFSAPGQLHRQFFDRSIVLTTQFSTTPAYTVDGCSTFQLTVNLGAATTPPQLQIQGSEDGTNWYTMNGAALVGVASSTVIQVSKDYLPKFVRGIVATAGATVTPGYVSIKAVGS